jgi:antibiotic biosynthesis monooxygenase (ABM) superfamily enzyme
VRRSVTKRWLAEILEASSRFPGYLNRDIFRPHDGDRKYTSVVRFDSLESLNGWAESQTRECFVNSVHNLLEEGDQVEIKSGIDFWFTPKGVKPPKLWKAVRADRFGGLSIKPDHPILYSDSSR